MAVEEIAVFTLVVIRIKATCAFPSSFPHITKRRRLDEFSRTFRAISLQK